VITGEDKRTKENKKDNKNLTVCIIFNMKEKVSKRVSISRWKRGVVDSSSAKSDHERNEGTNVLR